MNPRSLSEIAYDLASIQVPELEPRMIDEALAQAGIDPSDERERFRFKNLFDAHKPLAKQDALARFRFARDAREMLGSEASDDDVILLAQELERMCQ